MSRVVDGVVGVGVGGAHLGFEAGRVGVFYNMNIRIIIMIYFIRIKIEF